MDDISSLRAENARLRERREFERKIHGWLVEFLKIEGVFDCWTVFVHAKINGVDYRAAREREGWAVRREG
jgi:hypothetical protein